MIIKKGSKIRYNGYGDGTGSPYLTVGKVYEVIRTGEHASKYAVILDDRGETYVWSYPLKINAEQFNLVTDTLPIPLAGVHVKVGDKIRFNGAMGYTATTKGKEYEVIHVSGGRARYIGDDGHRYMWYSDNYPTHFNVVPAQSIVPTERDLNTLQEGDIIRFMGATGEDWDCYRDTTIGKEYEILRVVRDDEGNVIRVRYHDDANDEISWRTNRYDEMYHFKVMTEKRLYKDDVLATAPTKLDLESMMDLALDLEDISWAQDIYNQIQQLEGEHA